MWKIHDDCIEEEFFPMFYTWIVKRCCLFIFKMSWICYGNPLKWKRTFFFHYLVIDFWKKRGNSLSLWDSSEWKFIYIGFSMRKFPSFISRATLIRWQERKKKALPSLYKRIYVSNIINIMFSLNIAPLAREKPIMFPEPHRNSIKYFFFLLEFFYFISFFALISISRELLLFNI